jgi:hypothetical protein
MTLWSAHILFIVRVAASILKVDMMIKPSQWKVVNHLFSKELEVSGF